MVLKEAVRAFLCLINTVTIALGIAIAALGIFCISKSKSEPLKDIEHGTLISFVAFVFVIGIFVIMLGCLGCFGSLTQSPRMMTLYMGLTTIILILELAAMVGVFAKRKQIKQQADEGFKKYVEEYYDNTTDSDVRKGIDVIQFNLKCCGYNGAADYGSNIPASCCSLEVERYDECPSDKRIMDGCKEDLAKFVGNLVIMFGIVMAVAVLLDVLTTFGACFIRRNVSRYDQIA